MNNNNLLSIKNITKRFGGTQALDDVSCEIKQGEIHALLGENGAGKSTLVKIISGAVMRDGGEIIMEGQPLNFRNPQQARLAGINVVYQELSLVPGLSVAENICASNERMNTFKIMNLNDLGEDVISILDMLGADPSTPVKALGIGAQQMVEIAAAICQKCRLLILDEPTASLTDEEIDKLFRIVRILKKQGTTIIYISHKLSEIFEIADRVTVLKDGKFVSTARTEDLTEKDLVKLMTGRDLVEMFPKKTKNVGRVILEIEDFSGSGFNNISFNLREGEILGFAGLTGAGRTELCTTIFGVRKAYKGTIQLFDKDYSVQNVKKAMREGIGYLPEDRKEAGAFMQMNIKENSIAATIDSITKHGIINNKTARKNTLEMIEKLNTKVKSINDRILALSGGNQQKIILSRWLLASPKILIADEPTRGIDVGAKFEIYQILRNLANSGMAIILISSELPEIIGMSDRVITMYKGTISSEINCDEIDLEEKIGAGIMGVNFDRPDKEILQ